MTETGDSPPNVNADPELLAELSDDFAQRFRRGEHPTVEEYARQYPALAEQIRELFPALVLIEQSGMQAAAIAHPDERRGTVIGRYKLQERIGEGGFGVVFMAEQQHPVRRKVALKVIKPGLDTQQIIARFEAERQALAMMEHENIARVFDAGATDSGRPYFVMELVHGIPITDYCDQNQLPPKQRLELFVKVCAAVQHAHTKGVIHRDIKPTNVLVTLHDGVAVPKVIDFGVAKATGQEPLTDGTLFTQFAQMVGTPLYMSPEQAEMSAMDVDTRSDIYSLGVLLYELLTGTTPFDKQRLLQAAHDEVRRIIREEEPPRPSTRISAFQGEKLATVSADRKTDARRLGQLVRGELDWIVMKALEKDRARRYETAAGLAKDVQRYLSDEPVQACPPTVSYRLRKFIRRNWAVLTTAALLALALLIAAGGIAWTVHDRTAREERAIRERTGRQARVSGQLELILNEVAQLEAAEKWSEALISARRAEPALATGDAAPDIQGRAGQALADLELVRRLEETRMQSGTAWGDGQPFKTSAVKTDRDYMDAFREAGIDVDALPLKEAAARITARKTIAAALLPALDDWVAIRSKFNDASSARTLVDLLRVADPDPWRQRMRDILARKDWSALDELVKSPDLDRQPAATLSFLCSALRWSQNDLPEIAVLRRAQSKYPADFWINHRLGVNLIWQRSPDQVREGIGYMRAAVAVRPQSGHAMMNLGNGYFGLGEYDQAITCFRRAIELRPASSPISFGNLGEALVHVGRYQEAIVAFEQSIQQGKDPVATASVHSDLALLLGNCPDARLRNSRRAAELSDKAIKIAPNYRNHWTAAGVVRYREGRWEEARTALEKSLQFRGEGGWGGQQPWPDAIDWLFLAMAHWQMGQMEDCRRCYEQSRIRIEQNQRFPNEKYQYEIIRQVRAEADELLARRSK